MRGGLTARTRFAVLLALLAGVPLPGCSAGAASSGAAAPPGVAVGEPGPGPVARTGSGDRPPPADEPGADEPGAAAPGFAVWVDPEADIRPSQIPPPVVRGDASLTLHAPESPIPAGFPVRIEATAGPEPWPWEGLLSWTSSDESVIRVDPAGVVTGSVPGSARVTAIGGTDTASVQLEIVPDRARILVVSPPEATARSGEVLHFTASVRSIDGAVLADSRVHWSTAPLEGERSARIDADGAFVAPAPGTWLVTATRGSLSSSAVVRVVARSPMMTLRPLTVAPLPDGGARAAGIRVFEGADGRDWAWIWTDQPARIHTWDVTDPSSPAPGRSLLTGAVRVHDIEIGGANSWAVVALSDSTSDAAGLLVLDLARPADPVPLARVTEGLEGGSIAVAVDGTTVWAATRDGGSLMGFDFSDPNSPRQVGSWKPDLADAGGSHIADLDVRNGIAMLARWHDGLTILDVGAGIRGGTVEHPVFVSEYRYRIRLDGQDWANTLRVRRWLDWVLLADGIHACDSCVDGPRGSVHIIDLTELERPREVARYGVPEAGVLDIEIDPRSEQLTAAFGTAGVRLVDLSGEMRGDLYRQGREVAAAPTGVVTRGRPGRSMARGASRLKQSIFVADMYAGLLVFGVESEGG